MGFILALVTLLELVGTTSDKQVSFNATGVDVDGAPILVEATEYIFAESPAAVPPNAAVRVLLAGTPTAGVNTVNFSGILGTVPDGTYDMTARFRAESGNWSAESNSIVVQVDSKNPSAPLNLRHGGS